MGKSTSAPRGLENSRSTVSLALSAGNPNSGTSSFFVNLGENQFLDNQGFVPFARVEDMSTVDYILRLNQVSDPSSGLASSDIPVLNEMNHLVYVERAFVLDPNPVSTSMSMASTITEAVTIEEDSPVPPLPVVVGANVPEPPALVLAVGAFMLWTIVKGPRR